MSKARPLAAPAPDWAVSDPNIFAILEGRGNSLEYAKCLQYGMHPKRMKLSEGAAIDKFQVDRSEALAQW